MILGLAGVSWYYETYRRPLAEIRLLERGRLRVVVATILINVLAVALLAYSTCA